MKKKKLNIIQDMLKKKIFIKKELKSLVLKSIIFNTNSIPELRMLCKLKLQKFDKKKFISKQTNNMCLKTGKIKSVLNMTKLGRHFIKQIAVSNNLQNFRINN